MIEGGLVERLERRPGEKQVRYRQLLGQTDEDPTPAPSPPHEQAVPSSNEASLQQSEVGELRERVERLEREVAEMRTRLAES